MLGRGDGAVGRPPLALTTDPPERMAAASASGFGSSTPAALVELARAGDRLAFGALVERRLDAAYRIARAILGDEADARDATQETFLAAWRDLRRLRDVQRFDAWFDRILVNSCRQTLRRRGRRTIHEIAASELIDPVDELRASGEAPDDRTVSLDTLERAFERLSPTDRTILVLHHLEGRPVEAIAAQFAIPSGTAKSRLHAARAALERALEAELR